MEPNTAGKKVEIAVHSTHTEALAFSERDTITQAQRHGIAHGCVTIRPFDGATSWRCSASSVAALRDRRAMRMWQCSTTIRAAWKTRSPESMRVLAPNSYAQLGQKSFENQLITVICLLRRHVLPFFV